MSCDEDCGNCKQINSKIKSNLKKCEVLHFSPVAIGHFDKKFKPIYFNKMFLDFFKIGPKDAENFDIQSFVKDKRSIVDDITNYVDVFKEYSKEVNIRRKDNSTLWVELRACKLTDGSIIVSLTNFENKHKERQELKKLAERDTLTTLFNRNTFFNRLNHALESVNRGNKVIVFYIDLDDFKCINDNFGHDVGDEVILTTAERLSHCVREGDTIARLGGDEFAILFSSGISKTYYKNIAEKIIKIIEEPFKLKNHKVTIGCSIGISIANHENNVSSEVLTKQCDLALYDAKNRGKHTFRIYDKNKSYNEGKK